MEVNWPSQIIKNIRIPFFAFGTLFFLSVFMDRIVVIMAGIHKTG